MKCSQMPPSQKDLLALLTSLPYITSRRIIADLMSVSEGESRKVVRILRRIGEKGKDGGNADDHKQTIDFIGQMDGHERLSGLLGYLENVEVQNRVDPELIMRLFDRWGKKKEAAFFAYKCAIREIAKGDLEAAMKHQSRAVSLLSDLLENSDCDKCFVSAALSLSDLSMSLRKRFKETLDVLRQACAVSQRLGDNRNFALTSLHMCRTFLVLHGPDNPIQSFIAALKIVDEIGDEDIKAEAAEFRGLYYYIQGMSKEAADYFEQALALHIPREGQLSKVWIPIFLGSCAAFLGEFYRAIGVLDASWRRALLRSDTSSAIIYRVYLGNILLMAGRTREALSHLEAAHRDALINNDLFSLTWVQRALAYYEFLEDRVQKSYSMIKKYLTDISELELHKPFYAHPWMLELLFEYHKRGYEPLPEYSFEREMGYALNGVNIHLRGVAFRIQAKQAEIKGEKTAHIESLLRRSEADLTYVKDPIELAKTRIEAARLKLHEGDQENARELTLLAWETLSPHESMGLPEELSLLVSREPSTSRVKDRGHSLLTRYMEMMEEFVPSANLDELLSRLVRAASRFFEAERGALFWFRNPGNSDPPMLRALYNLTHEDVESKGFYSNLALVRRAAKSSEPILTRLHGPSPRDKGSEILKAFCLPLDIRGQVHGVLYHDAAYSTGAFEGVDKWLLKRIAENMSNYVVRIVEYCKRMEQSARVALGETTAREELEEQEIMTQSGVMVRLLGQADRVAESAAPVLILGETGTGKELLARRLHTESSRCSMPFIAINLSSIPEGLLESELFGHEKGAFTGADHQKLGRMELANKGTLFIDEVGDIPKPVQVKLLRTLEEKSFFRVGGTRNIQSAFRLIAATNRDLMREVESGNFREDLYYRVGVVSLVLPPLRERGDDVIHIAQYYLTRFARLHHRPLPVLSSKDKASLRAYHWPGNVRELKNVVEQSVLLSEEEFELVIPTRPRKVAASSSPLGHPFSERPSMDEMQRRYINFVLKETGGKISGRGGAAEILGIKRTTLYSRIKRLGLGSS